MLLATRCPFCETVFRIQPQQLAARHGLVRCGHCQESFDASGSLFEVPAGGDFSKAVPIAANVAASLTAAAASAGATGSTASTAPAPSATPSATAPAPRNAATNPPNFSNASWDAWAPRADSRQTPPAGPSGESPRAPSAPAEPAEPRLAADTAAAPAAASASTRWTRAETEPVEPTLSGRAGPAVDPDEPHLSAQPAAGTTFGDLPPPTGTPFAMTREAPLGAPRRAGWRIAAVLLALVLLLLFAAQLAWWMRETVMVSWPGSVSLYRDACSKIGCRVMPPHDIDGLQVEPSDLRQVDDPHHLELKMPLHNHYDVALAYPAIELTLLDRQNTPVLRRVLWPQDYVPPGTRIDAGLPAGATQTMIVRLDTGNVLASNFRIEVFYP
jgi:predicted Zn finger-like uncharacterized protein